MDEQELEGGIANKGAVTRRGQYVLRPPNPYARSIHRFLAALSEVGFTGASVPAGFEDDGRERLLFIDGDVPLPPYPAWSQSDEALASIAGLIGGLHVAAREFDADGLDWSRALADPRGGPIVCHNDVCLENVVFRDGLAIGLLDFDFAAPGRPVFDVAAFARMCVPIDDDVNAARLGWHNADRPRRLRLISDIYGLVDDERAELLSCLDDTMAERGEFVRRQVQAGNANFIEMWRDMGGAERYERRLRWWNRSRRHFVAALAQSPGA